MEKTSERNERGQLTYCIDISGNEFWYEYDDNGNLTHVKNSSGYEWVGCKE